MIKDAFQLIVSIVICQMAGAIGGFFTAKSVNTWYKTLVKPALNPPGWIFGPVWFTLYTLMGISLWLVLKEQKTGINIKPALFVFGIQLILNALWSVVFFGLQSPQFAFYVIIALWIGILLSIILFYPINPTAAVLLIPYLLWVSFASYLNYSIWKLN